MNPVALRLVCALLVIGTPSLSTGQEIRTAAQDSQPKYIRSESGFTGLCPDILKAIERATPELKFTLQKEFIPLARIESYLDDGTLDMFCGIARTDKRKARFIFVEPPVYHTYNVLAARIDDKVEIRSFDDLRKLGDAGVALAISRNVQADILAAQRGIKVDAGAKDTSANLRKLVDGRGRFIFHNDFALIDEIKRDNLEHKIRILPAQFKTNEDGRYIIVSKKAPPELAQKISTTLEKLENSGELARLYRPYKP